MKLFICDRCGLTTEKRTRFSPDPKTELDLCGICEESLRDLIDRWMKEVKNTHDNTHDKYPLGSVKYG